MLGSLSLSFFLFSPPCKRVALLLLLLHVALHTPTNVLQHSPAPLLLLLLLFLLALSSIAYGRSINPFCMILPV